MKRFSNSIAVLITKNGEFPNKLKLADLTPIHKSGEKTCQEN